MRRTQRIYYSCEEHLVDSKHLPSIPNISASSDGDYHFLVLELWMLFNTPWLWQVSHITGSEAGLRNCNTWSELHLSQISAELCMMHLYFLDFLWWLVSRVVFNQASFSRNFSFAIIACLLKSITLTKAIKSMERAKKAT